MNIVLFRHAERENSASSNPPLNSRGVLQAQKLAEWVQMEFLPRPTKLLSSPRLRAQMTFMSLSQQINLELQSVRELDERQNSENATQFSKRVKNFLTYSATLSGTVFLCTHLDWIEEALREIPCDKDLVQEKYQFWTPGQFMSFEVTHQLWHMERFGSLEI